MKKISHSVTVLILIGTALFGATACRTAAIVAGAAVVGIGTYVYFERTLKGAENNSIEETTVATREALKDLSLPILKERSEDNRHIITSHSADDEITIELVSESATMTNVKITVGTFGNESLSRQILQRIEAHLPKHSS